MYGKEINVFLTVKKNCNIILGVYLMFLKNSVSSIDFQ